MTKTFFRARLPAAAPALGRTGGFCFARAFGLGETGLAATFGLGVPLATDSTARGSTIVSSGAGCLEMPASTFPIRRRLFFSTATSSTSISASSSNSTNAISSISPTSAFSISKPIPSLRIFRVQPKRMRTETRAESAIDAISGMLELRTKKPPTSAAKAKPSAAYVTRATTSGRDVSPGRRVSHDRVAH